METAHKIPADQLSPIKDSATHLKEMVWHEQFWLRISHRGYNECLHSHTKKHCAFYHGHANWTVHAIPLGYCCRHYWDSSWVANTGSSLRYHCIFSCNGYVCCPRICLHERGADDVCGCSELPIIYWYFQPEQSCGLAAVRMSDWVCPWCHFYTAASALSSTAAVSHGLSQMEAQLEVKTPQLITAQACLEQDPMLNPGGKRRDTGGKLWYVCMGKTKYLYLDRFK